MNRRGARAASLVIVMVLGALSLGDDTFREDDFRCEEAAKRIRACCPNADVANLQCTFHDGCGPGPASSAELSIATSACIRDASCARLVEYGVCAALAVRSAAPVDGVPPPAAIHCP